MSDIKKRFLVIGVIQSKNNGKYYASGRMWSTDKLCWIGSKNKDGSWGDQLIEIPINSFQKLKEKIVTHTFSIYKNCCTGYYFFL